MLALAATVRADAPGEAEAKAELYRLGVNAFVASMLIAWARSGADGDDPQWRNALALPERWQAPAFPLRGADLVALGELKGPEIGELLRRLEAEWIADGFAGSREQLLVRAVRLRAKN